MSDGDELVRRVMARAERAFADARGSHGWDHVTRVLRLCEHIGPLEGCDMTILRLAAILHDVGRSESDSMNGERCHAELGAELAADMLREEGADGRTCGEVIHCVATHRFRRGNPPESMEAKVLFDADKLDSIGAVGVARAFQFAGEVGAKLHDPDVDPETTEAYGPDDTAYREYLVKLRHIHERMLTKTGREMADSRSAFMTEFFGRLNEETRGDM